jgi:hypothetical protein
MADLRRGKLPDNLAAYAAALAGFTQDAIDRACTGFERTRRQEGEAAFPELGAMLDACRAHMRPDPKTAWTLERYAWVHNFDRWLEEQIAQGADREGLLQAHPEMRGSWVAFKNQTAAGTIQIPAGWCSRCGGRRRVPVDDEGRPWTNTKNPAAGLRPCPDCRTKLVLISA